MEIARGTDGRGRAELRGANPACWDRWRRHWEWTGCPRVWAVQTTRRQGNARPLRPPSEWVPGTLGKRLHSFLQCSVLDLGSPMRPAGRRGGLMSSLMKSSLIGVATVVCLACTLRKTEQSSPSVSIVGAK